MLSWYSRALRKGDEDEGDGAGGEGGSGIWEEISWADWGWGFWGDGDEGEDERGRGFVVNDGGKGKEIPWVGFGAGELGSCCTCSC